MMLDMTCKLITCVYFCYFGHKTKHFFLSVLRVCNIESLFKIGHKHWFNLLTYINL